MTTALVALHYQNEVVHAHGRIKLGVGDDEGARNAFVTRAGRLLAFARSVQIPVVSVRIAFRPDHADVIANCPIFRNVVAQRAMVEGSWGAKFHEGLGPAEGEFVVDHARVNAFHGSRLEEILRVLKADRLILAGVATNSVVSTTAACAADMGYEVTVIADACSSGNARLHEACLENMQLIAEVISLQSLEDRLGANSVARAPKSA